MNLTSNYIGRFAPSPSGPLHFGSLVAAVASFMDARRNDGTWLLRIEDLDPPRESISAPARIIDQLNAHHLHWDGDILYQSLRQDAYSAALDQLMQSGLAYPCDCTRKNTPAVYPGTCRDKPPGTVGKPHAFRLRVDTPMISIEDHILGPQQWRLGKDMGDFIIKRKDALFAYQLAVVVDDAFQHITHVVRGADLLESTPGQIYLAGRLNLPVPHYLHFPVVLGDSGDKLSKQTHAAPVSNHDAVNNLKHSLGFLGQQVPHRATEIGKLVDEAIANWNVNAIPKRLAIAQFLRGS
ncbi:MAG: tRNA glutamyl-Q(34) synthetase GluQRS [Proteobacteria bacterium]|nr:tRNA glutamyl-Q(34) synthetase GluQRS [Pseudomonadota bacterium]